MSEQTPTRDPFDLCGTTIQDKYRIDSVVGTGGFGVVYRGEHTGFGEPIAVKCLKLPSELDTEQRDSLLSRLQDEGRVLHRLSRLSPGIVQALDVGAVTSSKGQWVPYLVLEWLEGQTLAEHLKARAAAEEGPLALEEAIELLEPAARALAVAHSQKVAHRDVKPENLVLTEVSGQRTLKVLDFGIAKVLAHHSEFTAAPAATQKVATAFTPHYGAPEQFNKKRGATGPWTDVFALALILVELVSGERALDGDDATQLYIAAADPSARPTLRYRGVTTSDAVDRVLQRALAVDPHDRYPDAGTFWDELIAAVGQSAAPPSVEADQSDTTDFVSRHGIGLDRSELSQLDEELAAKRDETPPSKRGPEGAEGRTTQREGGRGGGDSDEAPTVEGAAPVATGGSRGDAADSTKDAHRDDDAPGRHGTDTKPSAGAAGGAARAPRKGTGSEVPIETLPPTSASERRSSWWMAIVALAAIAGAAMLYVKLQQEQSGPPFGGRHRTTGARPTPPPNRTDQPHLQGDAAVAGGAGMHPSTAAGGGDAGRRASDAGRDAHGGAGGAGGGAGVPAPPEDMVYVPLPATGPQPGVHRGFFLDRTEVTTGAYRECVSAGRCVRAARVVLTEQVTDDLFGADSTAPGGALTEPETLAEIWGPRCNDVRDEDRHPINCVNHASAVDYCRWKGRRLPSAAEWTLAATGGESWPYPWGSGAPRCGEACFGLNGSCVNSAVQVATCPVATAPKDRSPQGVLDLAANVAEWVADEVPTPAHLQPRRRVLGGAFTDEVDAITAAPSKTVPAVTAFVTIGFRCAMDLPGATEGEP